jgi:predicted GNAT superfamily acetyltransferase
MTGPDELTNMGRVTDLDLARPDTALGGADPRADEAVLAADAAARAADVRIREITALSRLDEVVRLYDGIWRRDKNPPITTELLRAFSKAGNYVGGAYEGDVLVGACVGFFAAPAHESLHSHIAGVSAAVRGRRVGFALKLHQRAWALLRGVGAIGWTFDPLVSRNAYFNLAKLAAEPAEYLTNFYGGMNDSINAGEESDRLLVNWPLRAPSVVAACAGEGRPVSADALRRGGASVLLGISELGAPLPGTASGPVTLVALPRDVEALRATDPGLAKEWRMALREALTGQLADGARITGFDRAGWYVVTRGDSP